jgi:hypothetical protein
LLLLHTFQTILYFLKVSLLWGCGPSKPLSHARMVLCCFRKEIVLAGFAAEAQAPMVVVDETKLSPTVGAAVLQLGHETLRRFGG